jgi:molecular chaperone GrpE
MPGSMNGDTPPISEATPDPHPEAASADSQPTTGESAADAAVDPPPAASPDASTPGREKDLEQRLAAQQAEHELLRSQYMRIAADFDNFRKRQSRDQEELRLRITSTTLSEILPVVDNFERARQQITPEGEEAQNVHRSYQSLYKQLVDVLKQLGVSAMRVVG